MQELKANAFVEIRRTIQSEESIKEAYYTALTQEFSSV